MRTMRWEIGCNRERPFGAPACWLAEQFADLRRSGSRPVEVRLFTSGVIPRTMTVVWHEDGMVHEECPLALDEVVVLKVLDAGALPRGRRER